MKIILASRLASEIEACAARIIESGGNVAELELGMFVVRDDSPEYHERVSSDPACIFYSFECGGENFHVTYF